MNINWARAHLSARSTSRLGPLDATLSACLVLLMFSLIFLAPGCERKSVDDYLAMGDQAVRESKLSDAEADYQAAIRRAPEDPHVYIALGNLYVLEQKPGPAQLEFMKVLDLEPKNAAAHAAMANLYLSESQFAMAEGQDRAAVALDPARANYYLDLAGVLTKEAKNSEAEAEIRTAIGLDPKSGQAHFTLANLLNTESGREAEAQAEYAQARALDPRLLTPSSAGAAPTASAAAAAEPGVKKIKPIDKKFLLTKDSPVYQNPDPSSPVVARVHKKGFVKVTGITGDWFQIRMRSGVVGFIPVKTAE